jgi:YebC/PmpR family DNA-binding regulatory protein
MSGHNKWTQIKRKKEKTDAQKSKIFGKLALLIAQEAKKNGGNREAPALKAAIDRGRAANMPNDNIERAIKKAISDNSAAIETVHYEAYGPGGSALIIEALTDNRNRATGEVKLILSKHGFSLAAPGSAVWAFKKSADGWQPTATLPLENADLSALESLVDELENSNEVQAVFTNAE